MVAADAAGRDLKRTREARAGVGVVADQVAQEQVRVDADRQGLHRLQCFEVAVDVRQDGVGHVTVPRSGGGVFGYRAAGSPTLAVTGSNRRATTQSGRGFSTLDGTLSTAAKA